MELCGESARETERFAVTAATGALGPVLAKLTAFLGDEYKLHEKTRQDIVSIKSDLEPVHHLLGMLWGTEDLDVACKDWVAEARELSYDIDDGIYGFALGLEHGDGSFVQRKATDSPFKEFMERVKDVSKRCGEMQKIGDTICNRNKLTTDPRALFLHRDASELVGMEEKEQELIRLLQNHEMVCIFGPGGMGKTTLADLVYHAIGNQFQCRVFVSLHPSPNITDILGNILSQVTDGSSTKPAADQNIVNDRSISLYEKSFGTEPAAEQNDFIEIISTFLSDKRYLVIIDDIWHWEEWEVIRKALPKNNRDCKLIMTTRVWSISWKFRIEQGARVYEPHFDRADAERLSAMRLMTKKSVEARGTNVKGVSTKIADICGGPCPLAVICLSSAWAESHLVKQSGDDGELDTWASHILYDGFLSSPSLKPLVKSLGLGFEDLPIQLRTCLLYCTLYPLGYRIDGVRLMRKLIAEGLVSQVGVAETYLEKLLSRYLLQWDTETTVKVNPDIRAFLVGKAKEDNFIAYDGVAGNSSHAKLQIRRISLSSTGPYPDEDVLSRTRSLVVCGEECQVDGVPFKALKKLRVLEIKSSRLQNGHLVAICGLIWLRYLDLDGCLQITELPSEIGRLQNLETLHAAGTRISKLPAEIGKLQQLKTLNVSGTKVTELPSEIMNLDQLLETLDISHTQVRELPKEIVKLQHLRTLDIRGTKLRELSGVEVPVSLLSVVLDTYICSYLVVKSPLCVISSSGGEEVISCSEEKHRKYLSIRVLFNHSGDYYRYEVRPVAMLCVAGRHMKVPQWVKQDLHNVCSLDIRLCKLEEEDLEFLKTQMPNLQALQLRFEVLPREPVAITGGGFPKLETFYVDCRLPPRVVTFKPRAMPKLKHLEFKFYTGTASQNYYMGINHLDSLEKVVFRCSEYYPSDGPGIHKTIEAVRKEATEHPNEIILCVNDTRPEVLRRGASGKQLEVKDIVEKEFEGCKNETAKRKREIEKKVEHICEQRHRLLTAVERRAEREKNNAVIEKEIEDRFAVLLRNDTTLNRNLMNGKRKLGKWKLKKGWDALVIKVFDCRWKQRGQPSGRRTSLSLKRKFKKRYAFLKRVLQKI